MGDNTTHVWFSIKFNEHLLGSSVEQSGKGPQLYHLLALLPKELSSPPRVWSPQ